MGIVLYLNLKWGGVGKINKGWQENGRSSLRLVVVLYKGCIYSYSAGEAVLGVDDLSAVLTEIIEVQSHSYYVGLSLRVPAHALDSIRATHADQKDRLLHTVKYVLEQVHPKPTWRTIADALKSQLVNMPHLSQKIEEKYCSQMQPTAAQGIVLTLSDVFLV